MANKMLIDATHPEETRVVVLRGNRVEEFDFETAHRKQLRGNIYLAKVTRVEPSLQAAFVDYGGNRHGFLAFSEIHPDYYQIPVADRQALIAEEERAARDDDDDFGRRDRRGRRRAEARRGPRPDETVQSDEVQQAEDHASDAVAGGEANGAAESAPLDEQAEALTADQPVEDTAQASDIELADPSNRELQFEGAEHGPAGTEPSEAAGDAPLLPESVAAEASPLAAGETAAGTPNGEVVAVEEAPEEEVVESVGGADALEEVPDRAPRYRRQYKIQEVIKRRQVMLVQVVKEERGTKGAALTTYLSLAGRYSVLMPNTARGGGISRKITSAEDRRRLREIADALDVPDGMGVILRTAGANRSNAEVARDFEYLLRQWEMVRDLTLKSTAPTLVYEEGSLIKRSIRDLYGKDVDEIIVSGELGYNEAKEFMRMLMPSHARNVKLYRDNQPLFTRYGIESQLDAMFSPVVQLKSGGYIVINQTEALVSIDVNSGRSTREHHIEDTALKTNVEAAVEIARQLRLRDLAGLIVIDFIDMDEKRNNRTVERRLKEALRDDRARIQVGRISHFGLLEMSRQRIRTSVLESSTEKCPYCGGSGHMRSVSSVALQVLRAIEETILKGATHNLIVRTRSDIALYVLNQKRAHLRALEERFHITITISADPQLGGQVAYAIDRGEQVMTIEQAKALVAQAEAAAPPLAADEDADIGVEETLEEGEDSIAPETAGESESTDELVGEAEDVQPGQFEHHGGHEGGGHRRRRRRRRGRGGRDREHEHGQFGQHRQHGGQHEPFAREGQGPHESPDFAPGNEFEPAAGGEGGHYAPQPQGEGYGDAQGGGRGDGEHRRRRRGRRGGRRNRRNREQFGQHGGEHRNDFRGEPHGDHRAEAEDESYGQPPHDHQPAPPFQPERSAEPSPQPHAAESHPRERVVEHVIPAAPPSQSEPEPPRRRSTVREPAPVFGGQAEPPRSVVAPEPAPIEAPAPVESAVDDANKPRRTGWWAKRLLGGGDKS